MGFIEVIKPICGKNGCNNINENFMEKIIKQLIGEDCFNKAKNAICKDRYNEWISLEKKIEELKKSFKSMSQLESQFLIDCDLFEFDCEEDIKFLIEQFNSKFPDIKLEIGKFYFLIKLYII